VLQAVFAAFLALLMAIGMLAIVVALVATLAVQWSPLRLKNPALRRLVFDLLAGVALPVLCLWYAPIMFTENGFLGGKERVLVYLVIGFQMLALLGWLAFETATGRTSRIFAGILACGVLTASAIGTILFPLSLIGLIVIVGILGFTPLLTAYVFGRNMVRALGRPPNGKLPTLSFLLGMAIAVGVPALVYVALGDVLHEALQRIPFPGPHQPFPFGFLAD